MREILSITTIIFLTWILYAPSGLSGEPQGVNNIVPFLFEFGLSGKDYDDHKEKVLEYEDDNRGVEPNFSFAGSRKFKDIYINLKGNYLNEKEQSYDIIFDTQRALKLDIEYRRFIHWLEHDPLKNPQKVISDALIVTRDFDSGSDYSIIRSLTTIDLNYIYPAFPYLNYGFNYREECRKGKEQALLLNLSDIGSLQINSKDRYLDQKTRDWTGSLTYQKGVLALDYQFNYRKFTEDEDAPKLAGESHSFKVFPDFDKFSNFMKFQVKLPYSTNLYLRYVWSDTESDYNNADIQYYSIESRLSGNPIKRMNFSIFYLYKDIENDDIILHSLNSRSAMNREINTFSGNISYRLLPRTTIQYSYDYIDTTRKWGNGAFPHRTVENLHRVCLTTNLWKGFRLKTEYKKKIADDPFINNETDLSSLPTDSDVVKVDLNIPISQNLFLTFSGEGGSKRNEDSRYEEKYLMPIINLSYKPSSTFNSFFTYAYLRECSDTPFVWDPLDPLLYNFKEKINLTEEFHSFTLGCNTQLTRNLVIGGEATYTLQRASFVSDDLAEVNLDYIGSISRNDISTWNTSLNATYKLSKSLMLNGQFRYLDYQDDANYLYDREGLAYTTYVGIKWTWL